MAKHEFDGHLKKLPFGRTCIHCFGREKGLATYCPGEPLTDEQRKGIEAETLDYFNGQWWLAETTWIHCPSVVDEEKLTEDVPVTDLPRTVEEDALALPCHECKAKIHIQEARADDRIITPNVRWTALCSDEDCPNDHQVFGVDKASVIHMWNRHQSNALNALSKASVPDPTPGTPQGDKSDSRSLEARVTDLESTVANILKGRVFRRH